VFPAFGRRLVGRALVKEARALVHQVRKTRLE
jgi:hypothetical protein